MNAGPFNDTSRFPDPVYKETVLRPLFDGAKNHHVEGFRLIDRAHLVMLHETGILTIEQARPIAARRGDEHPALLAAQRRIFDQLKAEHTRVVGYRLIVIPNQQGDSADFLFHCLPEAPPEPEGIGLVNSAGRGRLERRVAQGRPLEGPPFDSAAALARRGHS